MWWLLPKTEDYDIALVSLINVGWKRSFNDLCIKGLVINEHVKAWMRPISTRRKINKNNRPLERHRNGLRPYLDLFTLPEYFLMPVDERTPYILWTDATFDNFQYLAAA